MKHPSSKKVRLLVLLVVAVTCLLNSGCTSTSQKDGVTIQSKRGLNPMGWF